LEKVVDDLAIVIAVSETSPLDHLKEIEKDEVLEDFEGWVFFDLMLCHGLHTSNNQAELKFENGSFDRETFTVSGHQGRLNSKMSYARLAALGIAGSGFFCENPEVLKNGVLADEEIEEVRHFLGIDRPLLKVMIQRVKFWREHFMETLRKTRSELLALEYADDLLKEFDKRFPLSENE
jgi:hypothetical protein